MRGARYATTGRSSVFGGASPAKRRSASGPGDEAAEHRELVFEPEPADRAAAARRAPGDRGRRRRRSGRRRRARPDPAPASPGCCSRASPSPAGYARQERPHDAAQGLEIQLVQRQPLAEQAVRARAGGAPPRSARRCTATPEPLRAGMEVVRDDHVVAAIARRARSGARRPRSRAAASGAPRRAPEVRRRRDHLRQQLDGVDLQRRILGRRRRR